MLASRGPGDDEAEVYGQFVRQPFQSTKEQLDWGQDSEDGSRTWGMTEAQKRAQARIITTKTRQHAGRWSHNFSPSQGDTIYQDDGVERLSGRVRQGPEPAVGAEVARATRRDMRLSMNGQKLRKLCGDLLQDEKFRELQEKSRAKHKSVPLAWKGYEEAANRWRRKSSHTSPDLASNASEPYERTTATLEAESKLQQEINEARRSIQRVSISNNKTEKHDGNTISTTFSMEPRHRFSIAWDLTNRTSRSERDQSVSSTGDREFTGQDVRSQLSSPSDSIASASGMPLDEYGKQVVEELVSERLLDASLSSLPFTQTLHNNDGQQRASIGYTAGQSSQEHRSNRSSRGGRQKRERDNGRDPGDGDGDDSSTDDGDRRKSKKGKGLSERKRHLGLRCPFYLRQPDKYRSVQACSNEGGFSDFSRLRSHFKRVHTQPLRCPRCYEEMKSPLECNDHLRQDPPCQTRAKPNSDQLTLEEWVKTEQIVRATGSVEEKWSRLFRALFPTDEKVPPCYDKSVFLSQVDDVLAVAINSVLRTEFPTMARSSLERVKQEILQRCKDRLVHRNMPSREEIHRTPNVQYATPSERDDSALQPPLLSSQVPPFPHDHGLSSNEYFEENLATAPNRAVHAASGSHDGRSSDRVSHQPVRRLRALISSRTPSELNREVGNSTDSSHTTQLSNSLVLPQSHNTSMTSYSMHPNYRLQTLSEIAESTNSQGDLLENQDRQYETRHMNDNIDPPSEKWMFFDWSQNDNFDFDASLISEQAENQIHGVAWSDWRI